MDYLLAAVTVSALLMSLWQARRSGDDDTLWELRWRGLAADDRQRIANAARSRAEFKLPEEAQLAAGLRSRDRRREAHLRLWAIPLIFALAALTLGGAMALGTALMAVLGYTSAVDLWTRYRQRSGSPEL